MRRATFPLIKIGDRSEDGRQVLSVQINPTAFPLRVERALDDPLRHQFEAGRIESIVFTDDWVIGLGSLHDDLAMRIFGDGDTLFVEADTTVHDVAVDITNESTIEKVELDMHVLLTHATIGDNPLWDGCEVTLG